LSFCEDEAGEEKDDQYRNIGQLEFIEFHMSSPFWNNYTLEEEECNNVLYNKEVKPSFANNKVYNN